MVVVIVADTGHRIERVVRDRGIEPEEVRRRIDAQVSDEERAAVADVLLDNDGDPEHLEPQVDRLWADLVARASAGP